MTTSTKCLAGNAAYREQTHDQKLAIWQKILTGSKFQEVRDFLVAERGPDPKTRSFIIHLPTGLWRGLETTYHNTLWKLRDNPNADAELLRVLFEVV